MRYYHSKINFIFLRFHFQNISAELVIIFYSLKLLDIISNRYCAKGVYNGNTIIKIYFLFHEINAFPEWLEECYQTGDLNRAIPKAVKIRKWKSKSGRCNAEHRRSIQK